jgi:hypothetical protein
MIPESEEDLTIDADQILDVVMIQESEEDLNKDADQTIAKPGASPLDVVMIPESEEDLMTDADQTIDEDLTNRTINRLKSQRFSLEVPLVHLQGKESLTTKTHMSTKD